ncbi:hypothetical protein Trydic_g1177 [Trypoxylus dichotomus]
MTLFIKSLGSTLNVWRHDLRKLSSKCYGNFDSTGSRVKWTVTKKRGRREVKVMAGKRVMGAGVSVHPNWVLTSKFFGEMRPKGEILRVSTWDSSKNDGMFGEAREVEEIIDHPKINSAHCNYDLVLLRLEDPFFFSVSHGIVKFKNYPPIYKYNSVHVAAAYRDTVEVKEVVVKPLDECREHGSYEAYVRCPTHKTLICINISEPVYGAPILLNRKLIGILSSDMDHEVKQATFHYISTYVEWMPFKLYRIELMDSEYPNSQEDLEEYLQKESQPCTSEERGILDIKYKEDTVDCRKSGIRKRPMRRRFTNRQTLCYNCIDVRQG